MKPSYTSNNSDLVETFENQISSVLESTQIIIASNELLQQSEKTSDCLLEPADNQTSSDLEKESSVSTQFELFSNESLQEPENQCDLSNDIGYYIDNLHLSDYNKYILLENPWTPPENYAFPYNEVIKLGKVTKKYAQRSHLQKFNWLVLSNKDKGLYCRYCVIFAKTTGYGNRNNATLRKLVNEPLKKFDNLLGERGDLTLHAKNRYHIDAVDTGQNFLIAYKNPEISIVNRLDRKRIAEVNENKKRLIPIIKTIILCGRQGIALRGHRDDKNFGNILNADSIINEGNFRALLSYRIDAGDNELRKHLESSAANATYISKTSQNEIISCCREEIQHIILARVKDAKFYSVIFDETTDLSNISQLSISVRYLHELKVREDFITFADNYAEIKEKNTESSGKEIRLTGVALGHIVENLLKNFDLDLQFCVGFGVDSCSVMASESKGAVQELKKVAKHAQRCPCNNHILNNSLAKSCKVVACRNASATMRTIVAFANASPKRHTIFKREMGAFIQNICETRWVERHEGHLQFQGESIIKICNALEEISLWQDPKTASEAFSLLQAVRSPEFLISVACLSDVLGVTLSLSRLLQNSTLDLKTGTEAIQDVKSVLEEKRENAEIVFSNLFSEIIDIAKELDVDLKIPRIVAHQTHRANLPANSCEEYFRRSIYVPLLDYVITDLKDRLSMEVMRLFNLRIILPKTDIISEDLIILKELVNTYQDLIGLSSSFSTVKQEFLLWVQKWKRVVQNKGKLPDTVVEALENCNSDIYPTMNIFLRILATLPVSTATAERSFSTLRRLKTWLRSNTGEERLVGLALMSIHRDIVLDPESIIVRFAKSNRRKDFII